MFSLFQVFDSHLCLTQIQYSGMIETLIIRRNGYPIRPLFADFIDRYRFVLHFCYYPLVLSRFSYLYNRARYQTQKLVKLWRTIYHHGDLNCLNVHLNDSGLEILVGNYQYFLEWEIHQSTKYWEVIIYCNFLE